MPFSVDVIWIRETEQKLGVRFPAAFVTSMVSENGGSVLTANDRFQLFPFFDASDKKRIRRTCNSIDRETAEARKSWCGFPANAIAIAENDGGDLLVLLPMEESPETLQNTVYWWDHETGAVAWVADDFGDLARE
jgi:hypothetical protein